MKVLVLLPTVALASGQHTIQYRVVKKVFDFRTPAPHYRGHLNYFYTLVQKILQSKSIVLTV
jgi:hypothetical protein